MIEADMCKQFLNQRVGVVHSDSGKDYFLEGILIFVNKNSLTIEHPLHGKCILSLNCIKKVKEVRKNGVQSKTQRRKNSRSPICKE
jgi:hypothetical protein